VFNILEIQPGFGLLSAIRSALMRPSILTTVMMVLALVIPAGAKPTPKSPLISKAPALNQPTAALTRVASSSKVSRSFLPATPKLAAKTATKPVAPEKPAVAPAVAKTTVDASAITSAGTPTINSPLPKGALARLTAYWTDEDYYTSQHMSSTGVRLHEGHCAVDPSLIPYGSVINIPGMGNYRAVDTGSAVVSRQAAIGAAHTTPERNALVVDLFFENRQEAEQFAAHGPTFVSVSWNKPMTASDAPLNPRALPANGTDPQETARIQVYVLESAPSLADCRLPLNFRSPAVFQ
jgi:3D (Asp-Asp-Asp) domain-containing protein